MHGKIIKRIIEENDNLSAQGLQKALGKSHSTINKILNDKRKIKIDEIPIIEKYLGQTFSQTNFIDSIPLKVVLIQVMGIIEHNVWRERATAEMGLNESIPAVPGYNLPGGNQVAYRIGQNIGKYKTGEYLICSNHHNIQSFIETNMKVVATFSKGNMLETGLYMVIKSSSGEYRLKKFDCSDIVSIKDVTIQGLVMATIAPEIPTTNINH